MALFGDEYCSIDPFPTSELEGFDVVDWDELSSCTFMSPSYDVRVTRNERTDV